MNIYDFKVNDSKQNEVSLEKYKGKVVLIINTAIQCGLTPQYTALENIYEKYNKKGLEILDFPCNQFLEQAPGTDAEIDSFCQLNYHTTFPRFAKIDVNGDNTHPLFKYLKDNTNNEIAASDDKAFKEKVKKLNPYFEEKDIKWNFTKFLIDKDGSVIARFSPTYSPEEIVEKIEKIL